MLRYGSSADGCKILSRHYLNGKRSRLMQLLSTQFTHDGRTLKQLSRSDKAAIYELRGWQGLLYGYEVIRVRVQKEREQFGKIFAEREAYPAASQFGYIAWSYGSKHKR